jgi:hypothetical protein
MIAQATAPAFACIGWYDLKGNHHECDVDSPESFAKNRCQRCYHNERKATGEVRRIDTRETLRAPLTLSRPAATSQPVAEEPPIPTAMPTPVTETQPIAPQPIAPPAPPAPSLVAEVPVLRPRHVRPIMSFAIVCANCDSPLIQGDHQTIAGYVGKPLVCRECGAAWRVEATTLGEHTERRETAA